MRPPFAARSPGARVCGIAALVALPDQSTLLEMSDESQTGEMLQMLREGALGMLEGTAEARALGVDMREIDISVAQLCDGIARVEKHAREQESKPT